MPSAYLSGGDKRAYGVANASDADIQSASLMIDAHCRRPEGLIWKPDGSGAPCYMAGATVLFATKLQGAIAPGQNVVAPFVQKCTPDMIGRVVVLDRGQDSVVEACEISAVLNGVPTLRNVLFAHAPQATVEFGLTIDEELHVPRGRAIVQVSRPQPQRLLAMQGRYAYGRRSDQIGGYNWLNEDINVLASVMTMGGPPPWVEINTDAAGFSPITGEVWIPSGMLMSAFSEVRVWYVSGFPLDQIPAGVKEATAQLVKSMQGMPLPADIRSAAVGDAKLERFADDQMSEVTRGLLRPYVATAFL